MKIALLSDATVRPLASRLRRDAALAGFSVEVSCHEYALQELLDPGFPLYAEPPQLVALFAHLSEACPELRRSATLLSGPERVEALADELAETLLRWADLARDGTGATVLLADLPVPLRSPLGIQDAAVPVGLRAAVRRVNRALASGARRRSGVVLFERSVAAETAGAGRQDPKLRCLAGQHESRTMIAALSDLLLRHVHALAGRTRKVLVLDMDDTLWGGILGEEGLSGIDLGPTGRGRAFQDFQRACLDLRDRGVLLAIASKNDRDEALRALDAHPQGVLRSRHFAAVEINWDDKAASCRRIAEYLGLGLDSLVFFDDNPVERAWVAAACPEVEVVEVPEDPARRVEALLGLRSFETASLSAEDLGRSEMYRARARRRETRAACASLEEYLESLGTEMAVGELDSFTLPRVAQLVNKTNQLNMTTRRRTEAEIAELARRPDHEVLWARARDRFGDAGIVGVAITRRDGDELELDTFLFSCRVLCRGMEGAFLERIVARARRAGLRRLRARYLRTAKNQSNRYMFRDAGMRVVSDEEGQVVFELEIPERPWRSSQRGADTVRVRAGGGSREEAA